MPLPENPALAGAATEAVHASAEVAVNTGAQLAALSVEVAKTALPIAGIMYFTVAGIKTLFGYPPGWVKAITPGSSPG